MSNLTAINETQEIIESPQVKAGRSENEMKNKKQQKRFKILLVVLTIGLFISVTLSVMLGPVTIHALTVWKVLLSNVPLIGDLITEDLTPTQNNIIWEIRVPRTLLGAVVGAGLAVVGVGIQALVKTP